MVAHNISHTKDEIKYLAKGFVTFPLWWYVNGTKVFLRLFYRSAVYTDQSLAGLVMLKHLFVPLFGDYSILGLAISFPFRVFRIVLAAFAVLAVSVMVVAFYGVWLVLPPVLLSLFDDFVSFGQIGLYVLLFAWWVYFVNHLFGARKQVSGNFSEDLDLLDYCERGVRNVLKGGKTPQQLFDILISHKGMQDFLTRWERLEDFPAEKLGGANLENIHHNSFNEASKLEEPYIRLRHVFLAILKEVGYRYEEGLETALWEKRRLHWHRVPFIWDSDYEVGPIGGVNRGWTGRVTPNLDSVSTDLTREAARGRLRTVIGKDKSLSDAVRVLSRRAQANTLLVGPPGSGKTTLVYGIAQSVIYGTHEEALSGKRVVSLDTGSLVAGAKTQGDLGERIKKIIREIESSKGIILFIDEIHNLVTAGGDVETAFVFNSLRPHLREGDFQMIGATSWENYRKYLAPNEEFSHLFELVEVPEASKEESVKILEYQALELERRYGVVITYPAIASAVELSIKLIQDRVLPDKAMALLEEAAIESQAQKKDTVNMEDIAKLVSLKTHVPVSAITQEESEKLLNLEDEIHEFLIDQEEAVKAVSDALRRARAGLRDEDRPIAAFLFVGPTGVGKTELSKTLSKIYFGAESAMIRLDMSEFQDQKNIYRLIGSPLGESGAAEGGQLTEAIRRRPFSLVLLDEFEKAHPEILNLFLQVFEDGRLTDGKGETVNFDNSILIATSNAGTRLIQERMAQGKVIDDFKTELLETLKDSFAPELLNRFDSIIIFKPLNEDHIRQIVELKLNKLARELEKGKEVKVKFTDEFVDRLAKEGFDPQWGARPLSRLVQDKVEAPLAKKFLSGEIKKGQAVTLDLDFLP